MVGIELQYSLECGFSLCQIVLAGAGFGSFRRLPQGQAQLVMGFGKVWTQVDRLLELADSR